MPFTPADIQDVTFDKPAFGKRGYNEDQVDDFLDRIGATLVGRDTLSADEVRDVAFEAGSLLRRGYDEDQVDAFLDKIVEDLRLRERRGGAARQAPEGRQTPVERAPTGQGQQFAQPSGQHSIPPQGPGQPQFGQHSAQFGVPSTGAHGIPVPGAGMPLPPGPGPGQHSGGHQIPPALAGARRGATGERPLPGRTPGQSHQQRQPAQQSGQHAQPQLDSLSLPLPPTPPGTRGYRPTDVERLIRLIHLAIRADGTGPRADDLTAAKLSMTYFTGQGYDIAAVDAMTAAWITELRRRGR